MSLFDLGCDDGTAGVSPAAASDDPVSNRIAVVDRYMGDLDRALARAPIAAPRRRAWGTLFSKWRDFSVSGDAAGVADRYLKVAGAFAADLGAAAPPAPAAVIVNTGAPPAKKSHWLRWTLVVGGLGTAGYFGWRWWASRRRGSTGAGVGESSGSTVEEVLPGQAGHYPAAATLSDRIRVLTANPQHNPPVWVRDEVIWANAKQAVRPYWERYHDPYAVVTEVYRKMGGRIADQAVS